jgi:hypothetical protein
VPGHHWPARRPSSDRGPTCPHRRFGDAAGAVYGLAVGDVDGDGKPDIVAARSGAPSLLFFNDLAPRTSGSGR